MFRKKGWFILCLFFLVFYFFTSLRRQSYAASATVGAEGSIPSSSEGADEAPPFCPARESYLQYLKGLLLEKEGKVSLALEAYEQSLKFDPQSRYLQREVGRVYFRLGQFNSALEIFEKLISENEKDIETLLLLAQVYLTQGEEKKAISCYEKILTFEPENREALLNLANLLSKDKIREATLFYEHYLNLEPLSGETINAIFKLANLYLKLGDNEKGLSLYQKVIENYPHSEFAFLAHLNRAQIYEKLGDKEKSSWEYELALSLEPENTTLNLKLGALYYETKKSTAAKEFFTKILKKEPKNIEAHYYLVLVAVEEKNWDEALYHAKIIARSRKNDPKIHYQIGYFYSQKKEIRKALQALKKTVELEPNNPENYYLLGLAYQELKKYTLAEKVYQRALELKPDTVEVLLQLAVLYDQRKETGKAIEFFRKVLSLQPKNAIALNYIGYTCAEQGVNLEEAENLINQALEIEPNNAAYIDSLGWVYYQKKDYENARIKLEQASQLLEDPVIFEHLGDTYKILGKLVEAKNVWEKALKLDPKNKNLKHKLEEINQYLLPGSKIRKLVKRQEGNQKQIFTLVSLVDVELTTQGNTYSLPVLFYYLSPKTMRIDLLGSFSLPQLTIIINEEINFFPQGQTLIPSREILILGKLLQDWLNGNLYYLFDDTLLKVKKSGSYYYLYGGNKQAKIKKENGLFHHCYLDEEKVELGFDSYVLFEGLWLPKRIKINLLEKKLSFFLKFKNFLLNEKLEEKTFFLPEVKQ